LYVLRKERIIRNTSLILCPAEKGIETLVRRATLPGGHFLISSEPLPLWSLPVMKKCIVGAIGNRPLCPANQPCQIGNIHIVLTRPHGSAPDKKNVL